MKKTLTLIIAIFSCSFFVNGQAPAAFNHPGVLSSQSELDSLNAKVALNSASPIVAGYKILANENLGDLSYSPTPYADVYVIGSGSCPEEKAFRQDAHALYIHALKWVATGSEEHRDKAIEIADVWAETFERIIPEQNKPNQSTLEASWALPIWVAGAEILKYYNDGVSGWSSTNFDGFVREVLIYVNGNIYQTANWLISKDLSLMAAGVFLNDKDIYNQGYNHVTGQIDAITVNGEIPELMRDFVHSQYVLIGLAQCAEIAWQQNNSSLFTRSNARLKTGAEAYVQSVMGIIQPNYFSSSDWARKSAPYEILLNRYTKLGMDVPNVQSYVQSYNRPENGSEDHFVGWLSATHAIEISGESSNNVPGNVAYQKEVLASSEPQLENPATSVNDNNVYSRWSASGFPQSIEIDLGSAQLINKTEVMCYNNRAYQFVIETRIASTDSWELAVDRSGNTTPGAVDSPITDEFEPLEARYVRLTVSGADNYTGDWVSISELRIFGPDDTTTGTRESDLVSNLYPNPVMGLLNISAQLPIRSISIYNLSGQIMAAQTDINSRTAQFDLSSFSAGTYIYRLNDNKGKQKSGLLIKE